MLVKRSEDDLRWSALVARARSADGEFVYSVTTTGIYCRPSCPSRLAKREYVAFHEDPARAEAAGFRPCKRCRPTGPSLEARHAGIVAAACRAIEAAPTPPRLEDLARTASMSPFHFHRVFKSMTGITPKAYADAERMRRVRNGLADRGSVTEAIYDAGFNSGSRFYERSDETLGMTPTRFRRGGERMTIRFALGECSLGAILVAATDKGVCALLLGDDPQVLIRDLQDRFDRADLIGGDEVFEGFVARAVALVENPGQGVDLPLDVRGTAFQRKVWGALRDIEAGKTASYGGIAEAVGAPKAARAVAQACAANNIAIAIPCHRVVRNSGALSGYAWGVERKRALLDREAAA